MGNGEGEGAQRGEASDSVHGSTCLMAERVRGQDANFFSHSACTCAAENPQHVGSDPSNSPVAPCGTSAGRDMRAMNGARPGFGAGAREQRNRFTWGQNFWLRCYLCDAHLSLPGAARCAHACASARAPQRRAAPLARPRLHPREWHPRARSPSAANGNVGMSGSTDGRSSPTPQ